MIELQVLLDMGEEFARKVLLEHRHRELVATYHLIGADGNHQVIGCPWENDLQKQIYLAYVRGKAKSIQCQAFSFVCEGWSVTRPNDGSQWKGPMPKDDPNRIEIVNISAANTEATTSILLHMVRDLSPGMNNRLIGLEPMERIGNSMGRMVEGIIQK